MGAVLFVEGVAVLLAVVAVLFGACVVLLLLEEDGVLFANPVVDVDWDGVFGVVGVVFFDAAFFDVAFFDVAFLTFFAFVLMVSPLTKVCAPGFDDVIAMPFDLPTVWTLESSLNRFAVLAGAGESDRRSGASAR